VEEIDRIDMLKIDIQGGELAVFKNASRKLADAVFIQTEVAYVPLYEGQPVLGELDLELRHLGFIPHCFASTKKAIIPPFRVGSSPWTTLNQLLDGDMVYVRDFRDLSAMSMEQLKLMAIIAHGCYESWDLSYRIIQHLESERQILPQSCESYLGIVNALLARSGND